MNLIAQRQVDDLGRIVIPIEFRRRQGITAESSLSIYEENGRLILEKAVPICRLCSAKEEVVKEVQLCRDCIARVKSSL